MPINKAFVGFVDIASLIGEYAQGFLANKIPTTTCIFGKTHVAQGSSVDFDLSMYPAYKYKWVRPFRAQLYFRDKFNFVKNKIFKSALSECDVFLFIDNTFYGDNSDLVKIKKAGKKIVSILTGDDCRWYGAMKQEFERYGMQAVDYPEEYDLSLRSMEGRLRYLRVCEKYADIIFSLPNQAQLALRPYHAWRLPIDTKRFKINTKQHAIPTIVHAPSSRAFKGTKYILSAIERLKSEGIAFQFEMVENLPNEEALIRYYESDIIVSQVMCPSGGRLALEGLAMGKVVLSKMGFDNGYDEKFPDPCPIVDVSPQTIYDRLKEVILDLSFREKRALEGPKYIDQYFSCEKVVKNIVALLKEPLATPDFYPSFFKKNFVPENEEAAIIYNRWNSFVRDCDWYRGNIENHKRAGLIF